MSHGFQDLIHSLQGDFSLIAEFLENPEQVTAKYKLSSSERNAVLSRDFDALAALCGSQQMAAGVLSSAHTPTCGNRTQTKHF